MSSRIKTQVKTSAKASPSKLSASKSLPPSLPAPLSRTELKSRRPTSPHLSIYRLPFAAIMSISHRITGVILFAALSIAAWWSIAFTFFGPCPWTLYIMHTTLFNLTLKAITFCSIYHLFNGIRHLFWDMGVGFSLCAVDISGWIVVLLSIISTITIWGVIL